MNITLKHLEGMWLTKDCNFSMWIGGTNHEKLEICINRTPVISEQTHFEHVKECNICRLSDSVCLWQLFDDESIRVRFQIDEKSYDLFFFRRK